MLSVPRQGPPYRRFSGGTEAGSNLSPVIAVQTCICTSIMCPTTASVGSHLGRCLVAIALGRHSVSGLSECLASGASRRPAPPPPDPTGSGGALCARVTAGRTARNARTIGTGFIDGLSEYGFESTRSKPERQERIPVVTARTSACISLPWQRSIGSRFELAVAGGARSHDEPGRTAALHLRSPAHPRSPDDGPAYRSRDRSQPWSQSAVAQQRSVTPRPE